MPERLIFSVHACKRGITRYFGENVKTVVICTARTQGRKGEIHDTIFNQRSQLPGEYWCSQYTPTRCTRAMLYFCERPQPLIICTAKVESRKEEIHSQTIFNGRFQRPEGSVHVFLFTPTRRTRAMPYFDESQRNTGALNQLLVTIDESPQHLNATSGTRKHNYYCSAPTQQPPTTKIDSINSCIYQKERFHNLLCY